MKIITLKTITVALMLVSLWGCVQTRPVPGYARAGDVVVLGLGGVERNWSGLKAKNLTITITDSGNNTYDLIGLNPFKAYPDHAAFLNTSAIENGVPGLELEPFDGGWFLPVRLIENVPGSPPLPLVEGPALISLSAPDLNNTATAYEGDLLSIPIDILPGTTSVDNEYLQQFVGYAPTSNNFVIRPDNLSGVDSVAGAFFKIDYNDEAYFNAGIEPVVVPSGHNPYVQLAYNVVSNGNNTGSINVTLLNPAGFKPAGSGDTQASLLADLSVNMMYFAGGGDARPTIAKEKFELDISSSYYIDGSGAIIEGISPTLIHASEL